MVSDLEGGECSSDYSERGRSGQCLANSEVCSARIKSEQSSMNVTTNSSSVKLEHQETDNRSVDLMRNLSGGWSKKRRRGSGGTSPSTYAASASSIPHKIVLRIGGSDNERTELVVKKEFQEPSSLDKMIKEEEGLDRPVDHENRKVRRLKKTEPPVVKKELQESSNFNKFKVSAVKGEEGLHDPEKHKCKQCGQVFDDFRRLERHMSNHSCRKKRMEEEGDHKESKAKKNRKEVYQCDHCDKIFPTGQALGGHKRIHNNVNSIRTFD